MAVEDSNTKRCTKCGERKPLTEFSKNTSNRDGLRYQCKTCDSISQVKWRAANPDKVKSANAAYQKANAGKHRAAVDAWAKANPERVRAKTLAWQKANPEKNREHHRISAHNRRAREREYGGKLSIGLADRLFKLQRGKCACGCKQPLGDDYHLDHIMPLALGGANTDDNIQLLRAKCNMQKNAKHPVDFMRQRGFLL